MLSIFSEGNTLDVVLPTSNVISKVEYCRVFSAD